MSTSFHVDLQTFRGPLDLLLYLVRKHEVDVANIPIAMVAEPGGAHPEGAAKPARSKVRP